MGDIVGISGTLMRTNKGELSVHADNIVLLNKTLLPLPEKFHGVTDQEIRYRQRYVDLIVNEDTRGVFRTRSMVMQALRDFFNQRSYLEVETPAMQHPGRRSKAVYHPPQRWICRCFCVLPRAVFEASGGRWFRACLRDQPQLP